MEKKLREKLPNGRFENVSKEDAKRMGAISGRNNRTTELKFRLALVRSGIRGWTLHGNIRGKPDILFPTLKLVVFLDGCFWHGCPQCAHDIKKNSEFWAAKIQRNRERDSNTTQILQDSGYMVLRFWEHELQRDLLKCVAKVQDAVFQIGSRAI